MARARTLSAPYFYTINCNNNKSLYDQIDSKLIGSNIYWNKKHHKQWRSIKTIAFSQLFTVCWRERVKHINLKISLQFLSGKINYVGRKVLTWYNDFAFYIGKHVSICWMPMWVRKTAAKHQITQISELELTFSWKWNSEQKNNLKVTTQN